MAKQSRRRNVHGAEEVAEAEDREYAEERGQPAELTEDEKRRKLASIDATLAKYTLVLNRSIGRIARAQEGQERTQKLIDELRAERDKLTS